MKNSTVSSFLAHLEPIGWITVSHWEATVGCCQRKTDLHVLLYKNFIMGLYQFPSHYRIPYVLSIFLKTKLHQFFTYCPLSSSKEFERDLLQKKMHTRLKTTHKPKKFYHFRLILQIMLRLKIFSNMDSDTFNLFKRWKGRKMKTVYIYR